MTHQGIRAIRLWMVNAFAFVIAAFFLPVCVPAATSYTLTVEGGSGGGIYEAGQVVQVTADVPVEGEVFAYWSGQAKPRLDEERLEEYVGIQKEACIYDTSVSIIMPSHDFTLKANYEPAGTVEETAQPKNLHGSNAGNHEYGSYHANPVKSYLLTTEEGFLRLQATSDRKLLVEAYDSQYKFLRSRLIRLDLPLFGGLYAAEDAYYIVTGQNNFMESGEIESFRVTKYGKDWTRLSAVGLADCNTHTAFRSGSCRMSMSGKYLLIHTSHRMYKSKKDGKNHQANITMEVDTESMKFTASRFDASNASTGYVSHSFNQFAKTEDGKLVTVDHGDAYPRAIALMLYKEELSTGKFGDIPDFVEVMKFAGTEGKNETYATVGGFEISDSSYLIAGCSTDQETYEEKTRNIFLGVVDKASHTPDIQWLTSYGDSDKGCGTPVLSVLSDGNFMVLWSRSEEDGQKVYYQKVDGNGKTIGSAKSVPGDLSDCAPVEKDGKLIWYVHQEEKLFFYGIDLSTMVCEVTIVSDPANDPTPTDAPIPTVTGTPTPEANPTEEPTPELTNTPMPETTPTNTPTPKPVPTVNPYQNRNGSCGEKVNYTLDLDGTLTIYGEGAMEDYDYGNTTSPWYFYYNTSILNVVVEPGVTSIGDCAFIYCSNIKSIKLPEGLISIGKKSLLGCTSLASVTIPDSVRNIGDAAFWNCSILKSVKIPDGVTRIGDETFYECKELESLTIPDSVTSIEYCAFHGCRKLTSLVFTDGLISIGAYAFADCTGLKSVELPESVTNISRGAFYACSGLTSITIPGGIESIGEYAFMYCEGLTSVTISEGVTSVGEHAFAGCNNLTSVTIPKSVTSIGSAAFSAIEQTEDWIRNYSSSDLTLYGYSGTEAERYAKSFRHIFKSLDPEPTPTNTPTPTLTSTPTPEANPTEEPTPELTNTPMPEPTATNTPTPEPTATNTPTPEPTATNTPTPEPTATNTPTPEPTATNTPTPEPTATNTPMPEPTATNTPTPEPTATNTPAPTPTTAPMPAPVHAQSIKLNKSKANVLCGKTLQLKANVLPADAVDGEVTWSSDNKKIAVVSKKGLVTAKALGTVRIRATTANGVQAICEITVSCVYVYQCEKDGVYRYMTDIDTVKKLRDAGWSYKKAFRAPGLSSRKVYWVRNKTTKRYRYTTDLAYAKKMKKAGHKVGVTFYQSTAKSVPVYEFSKGTKKISYFYTSSASVRKKMKKAGWTETGIAWYAQPKG